MNEEAVSNSLRQLREAIDQLSAELETSKTSFRELDSGQEQLKELLTTEYADIIARRFEKTESTLRELDARTRALSARFEQEIEALSRKFLEEQKRNEEEEKIQRALQKLSGESVTIDRKILHELREKSQQ